MQKLLATDTFDTFQVTEATVTTFVTFSISGRLHSGYYDTQELREKQEAAEEQGNLPLKAEQEGGGQSIQSGWAVWKQIRPFVYEIIRGKKPPLNYRIVLRLADYNVEKLIRQTGLSVSPSQVSGLFLNISGQGQEVHVVTGTSLAVFTPDRTLDQVWDGMVEKLLKQKQIAYEKE